ncbi:peroxiredoxin [Reinekea marina]|uniref:Glutathione-dependent peroxiredoxin n=1 Tax=Reinekea marina TaxID=1310421 RepID=A0ABV7WPX7_9GAMM|nr:peroxiredoxin [Reinekea marina]MBU2864498.1 peroxiredoxin [Reinekea forsetii]MDN3647679.1 peroxiredoxin [Reinekea marina]
MPIKVGDTLPSVELSELSKEGPVKVSSDEIFANKKVVLFALPGAFTPTCSAAHLPGFVVKADELKAKGVDEIVCLSVNDAWVMGAWGESQNAENIRMIADGSANFTEAVDLVLDLTDANMGVRSERYALIANNGVVEWIGIEEGGFEHSSVEAVLNAL